MRRKITIILEDTINFNLEDFEDCSDEEELTDAIRDELENETFTINIGDDAYDLRIKSIDVTELPD